MSAINGEGFKSFGQFLLDTGTTFGRTNITDILPHPTTISRHIQKTAKEIRNELFKYIYVSIKKKLCASTCDMWTDNYRKNSYMSITLHYIDSNWELDNRLLMTGQFPSYEAKTGENIKRFMYNFFFQISESANEVNDDLMSCVTFVTDQGSNMLSALGNYNRLNCCARLLNTVLRNLFDIKFLEQEEFGIKPLEPILTLMVECKNLVKYMKSSGRNCELSKGLVQEVETRWNTRLLMFQSIHKALPEIIQIHGEHFGRIKNINTHLLEKIIQFLDPFKKASDDLEGDKCPTIHKAILYQHLLKKHLKKYADFRINMCNSDEEPTTDSILQILGKQGLKLMDSKFQLFNEHEIAVFLSPKFKSLKMFSEDDKARIYQHIEVKLLQIELEENSDPNSLLPKERDVPQNSSGSTPFSEWEDAENDSEYSENVPKYKKELEEYKQKYFEFDVKEDNVLTFWKNQMFNFPYLSILAKQIFAIPASSASSERSFSTAGRVVEERRSCLSGSTVDAILFLNNHLNNLKK